MEEFMNIKDLKYFHQLVKYKNFSKVAADFSVSQPTITMAIKRIEKQFNSRLFIRDQSHHELQVTASGYQLDEHVQQVLNELATAQKELKRINSTKVLFGLPPIIGTYYFPSITPALLRQGLMKHLETFETGSKDMLQLLLKGSLDLALIASLQPIEQHQITAQLFRNYNFKIIVSPQHPLARQKEVSFKDLVAEHFIVLDEGFIHNTAFKQFCQQYDFKPNIVYQTSDVHVLKAMVKENVGIAFLTEIAVPANEELVSLALTDPQQPHFLISLAYRKNYRLGSIQQQLITTLVEEAQNK
ncbi:LysR family transcriptional regulator [Liquorilactobacillus ghanensis DSM 18630]|uniref:LysR family transcriptional regulator n=4 Tax=Liquorilactobacillus ghanensis TaxID=399370 RepID=A0A0R1VTY3_9LACO|nr:LysR family transcriptional regulator [Liquorilactobacillus ghanensis DSM 18630]